MVTRISNISTHFETLLLLACPTWTSPDTSLIQKHAKSWPNLKSFISKTFPLCLMRNKIRNVKQFCKDIQWQMLQKAISHLWVLLSDYFEHEINFLPLNKILLPCCVYPEPVHTYTGTAADSLQESHHCWWGSLPVGTAGSIVGFSQVLICSQVNPLVPKATL